MSKKQTVRRKKQPQIRIKHSDSRRLRYRVAMSLDGYIAGPNGEFDWIVHDPTIDFAALFNEFDTLVMGRRTFELVQSSGKAIKGKEIIVFSRSLRTNKNKGVTVSRDVVATISHLKGKRGKDIWLFGGGELFRSLLDLDLVDSIEVAVIPILLSRGIPLLSPGSRSPSLRLTQTKAFPTGVVVLSYEICRTRSPAVG